MYEKRIDRTKRISHEIQKKLSIIIQRKINDPRIGDSTISGVNVSKDLKIAVVFITFWDKNTQEEIQFAITVLQRASHFIRYLLANSICLRTVPVLYFKYDNSLINGIKLYKLMNRLHKN